MTKPLHTAIVLNGPPNVGKDTLADIFIDNCPGAMKKQFKEQLYVDTMEEFHITRTVHQAEFMQRCTSRMSKEIAWHRLGGLSPRQALIHTSEYVIKPNQGKEYFGLAAATECLLSKAQVAIFADGGFQAEIEPLKEIYENVIIFRLHRDGCSFVGDSRTYLPCGEDVHDLRLVDNEPGIAIYEIYITLSNMLGKDADEFLSILEKTSEKSA